MNKRQQPQVNAPPAWAEALLRALVKPRDADFIAGDLVEEYRETVIPAKCAFRARVWYWVQVLSFLRLDALLRLRSAALSDRFLWAAAAGIAEYAVLFCVPEKTGAPAEVVAQWSTAALLLAGATSAIRSAADAWHIGRTSAFWLTLFGIVTVVTLRASVYTPVPLVAAFLVIVPAAGFQSARGTGILRTGTAAGLVIGTVTFLLGTALAATLRLPHPPLGAYPFPPAVAAILGTVGAFFGKSFAGRRELGYSLTCPETPNARKQSSGPAGV
jgi:hypothetical protein